MNAKRHYLGVDLGSSFTKFVVVDDTAKPVFSEVLPTLSRRREKFDNIMAQIIKNYAPAITCATGYGRRNFGSDIQKTELICAAAGVSAFYPHEKSVLDIGGEDIKIVECASDGMVRNFYMNDKCAAGTGAFIVEIAERAELDLAEMSDLAQKSSSQRIINSFCTVFAKSEILEWKFGGVPIEDIAHSIYLSIVTRIRKLPLREDLPIYLCGGVIAYHPYLHKLMQEELGGEITIVPTPQFTVAFGAAILARQSKTATSVEVP